MEIKFRLAFLALAYLATSSADAATWRCEEEERVGFSSQRGSQSLNFETRNYILKTGVTREDFTSLVLDFQWKNWSNERQPASIQVVGDTVKSLCVQYAFEDLKLSNNNYISSNTITCDDFSTAFNYWRFDLFSGLFTSMRSGFEDADGGASFVAIGKCYRID